MIDVQLAHETAHYTLLAADGLFDTANEKAGELQATARIAAGALSLVFFIWQTIQSRMAIARMVVAGLAAGVMLWIVFNVTEIQGRVDNELAAGAVASVPPAGPDALTVTGLPV